MPDVLLIIPLSGSSDSSLTYSVKYLRLQDDVDVDWMKNGMSIRDMPAGSVVEHGEVCSPDGSPAEPWSLGSVAISSPEAALEVARAALDNPNSEVRQRGFSEKTPIYYWQDGKSAQMLSN